MDHADVLDLRTLADRLRDLANDDQRDEEDQRELDALVNLAEDIAVGGCSSDPEEAADALQHTGDSYEPTLVRDSYFETYAQELAEDIGAIDPNATWPLNRIDWAAAAEDLKVDYNEITVDGIDYYIRQF